MNRKQFTFYRSFYESIQNLKTNKEKLLAYDMICKYALDGELPENLEGKSSVLAIFSLCRPIINRSRQRAFRALQEATLSQQE